jgi:hypothetical protein
MIDAFKNDSRSPIGTVDKNICGNEKMNLMNSTIGGNSNSIGRHVVGKGDAIQRREVSLHLLDGRNKLDD